MERTLDVDKDVPKGNSFINYLLADAVAFTIVLFSSVPSTRDCEETLK